MIINLNLDFESFMFGAVFGLLTVPILTLLIAIFGEAQFQQVRAERNSLREDLSVARAWAASIVKENDE